MSDEIKPALTPQEWAALAFDGGDGTHGAALDAHSAHPGPIVYVDTEDAQSLARVSRRHALAALALYGERFGFTHDDLRMLDNHPDLYGGYQGSREEQAWWAFIASLRDRIAALLPPEAP